MENPLLPQVNQSPNNDKKLGTLTNNEVLDVLIISNVSRPNNFNSLTKEEWKFLVTEIKKDFGDKLTHNELIQVITNGVKGNYDKTQFVINAFTIYRWIRIFISQRPKVKIPCPQGIESFYWEQMGEMEQKQWLENENNKITHINDSTSKTTKAS